MGALDLVRDIFTGGPQTVSTSSLSPQQKQLSAQFNDYMKTQIGQGVAPYEGQLTAGTNANQQAAFAGAGNLMNPQDPRFDQRGMTNAQNSALSGQAAFMPDQATRERYYQQGVVDPAKLQFADTMRGLDHRYGARFGRSGAQLDAANRAATNFNIGLAGQRANMFYQNDRDSAERAADRQLGAIGAVSGAQSQYYGDQRANLGALTALGGAERGIEQQGLSSEYYRDFNARPENNPMLAYLGTALSGNSPKAVIPGQSLFSLGNIFG